MKTGLEGRAALVTGASGGIGWATAEALAAEGCRLALHARQGGARLRQRVAAQPWSDRAIVVEADIRDAAAVDAMFEQAVDRLGGLQVCVANAGIWPAESRRMDELDPQRALDVLSTNLHGALWTARGFLRQAAATAMRGTSLVLVGSTAGRFGEAGHADYSISKAGLRGLMLSYKNEVVQVDPEGRCNLVEPGWTLTEMTLGALSDHDALRKVTSTMALRRIADAGEIASTVVFLASPRLAAHLSGQTLTVAGGMEGRLLWQREALDPEAIRADLMRRAGLPPPAGG